MSNLIKYITDVICGFNGVMLVKKNNVPDEIMDVYNYVYDTDAIKPTTSDKQNMHGDLMNFKHDFKHAINQYKAKVNG